MHNFDHCECGHCNGCVSVVTAKHEEKETDKALSGQFNKQSKYAWHKPTSHIVGQYMSGVVKGRVTHKNELCYGCHNFWVIW